MTWNGEYLQLGPATGLWAGYPLTCYCDPNYYFEMFEDFINPGVDDTSGNLTGWETYEDAGGALAMPAGHLGGVVTLTTNNVNNNEYTIQLGPTATSVAEPFVITDSSNNKMWFECRVNASHTQDAMVFIGFAQGGTAGRGTDQHGTGECGGSHIP